MNKRAEELIKKLKLIPHPEGGYFIETYRSSICFNSPVVNDKRCLVTDIYFLLVKGQISRFHRVRHDEIWHFYEGAPLSLIEIDPSTFNLCSTHLGSGRDLLKYQHIIKAGNWQTARSLGDYSLSGCTVSPGFEQNDFLFLKDSKKDMDKIISKYPALVKHI